MVVPVVIKTTYPFCRSQRPTEACGRTRAGSRDLGFKALSGILNALEPAEGNLDWLATVLSFGQL
ncbi:MAG TPA: hypothetical protein VKV95_00415 [Terriglobia bacterium]|nr:hypothetical protein [Terriglobia bacterium]